MRADMNGTALDPACCSLCLPNTFFFLNTKGENNIHSESRGRLRKCMTAKPGSRCSTLLVQEVEA